MANALDLTKLCRSFLGRTMEVKDNIIIQLQLYPWLSTALIAACVSYTLFHCYVGWGRVPSKTERGCAEFSRAKSATFERKRRAAFPPPYPNGWWRLCDVAELAGGKHRSISALGLEVVVFRVGGSDEVAVLDRWVESV